MARERQSLEWDRTCSLLVQTANLNRRPGSPLLKVEDCHPLRRRPRRGMSIASLHAMKDLPGQKVVTITLPHEAK